MRRAPLLCRFTNVALWATLLGGCVYYNGMYNAKRLAGSAWKAEREGRTFEANNLWGQVVTRAESVVVRHPDSKYVDEALILKGIALSRLRQCSDAIEPLARLAAIEVEGRTGEEAALALGRCHLELGDPGAADLAFSQVLESPDAGRRREASLQRAHALRRLGRLDDALAALEGLRGPKVSEERLLALGAAGRQAEMKALADTLLQVSDSVRTWDSVLTVVGQANPRAASALLDHLGTRRNMTPELRARRLLQDAERLRAVDSARATVRYREAVRTGVSEPGTRAALQLLRQDLRRTTEPAELVAIGDSVKRLANAGTAAAQETKLLLGTVLGVKAAADSGVPGSAQGDLRLFLAAEAARDSLLAPALAATLFRQLVETWPDSPYAPKAILAARVLDPEWGETTRPLLEERYAASPYLAFLRGEDAVGYRELEDSLRAYAAAASAGQRRTDPGVRRAIPRTVRPGDDAEPAPNPRRPNPTPRRGVEP